MFNIGKTRRLRIRAAPWSDRQIRASAACRCDRSIASDRGERSGPLQLQDQARLD
jgi:hypothetical protein